MPPCRTTARSHAPAALVYPDAVDGGRLSASFLHNGTVAMFERQGFERTRRIGKTRWVVRRAIA